jgi:dipeptidyl aminopeptidase/acylaminoacyl peptidase
MTAIDLLLGFAPSPDGRLLAYVSDASGRPQLWLRPLAEFDATDSASRLLPVDGAVVRCAWRPDGSRILVQVDPDGTEEYRLGEVDPRTGAVEWIAAESGVRHEVGAPYSAGSDPYSRDGRFLAYASNARDPTTFDVIVRDLATGTDRTVVRAGDPVPDDRYLPMFFSPDSRRLLVLRLHQNTEHDLFVADLDTGTLDHLTPHDGPAKYVPAAWTADGIYLCTTLGRDFTGLALLTPAGDLTWLHTTDHDVEGAALSGDGRRLIWGVNDAGYTALYWMEVGTGRPQPVTGLPRGVIAQDFGYAGHALRPSHDGRRVVVQVAGATTATDVWVADLPPPPAGARSATSRASAGITTRRVTDCGARLPAGAVEPEVVRFPSEDGLSVGGLLYRPGAATGRLPVVLHIHGGPEAQARPVYDPLIQGLLARGIGVLAPNIRGSGGRGLRYQRLIYRDWGGGDVGDLAAAAAFLGGLDWVDADRLGVFGASYGGFATLTCLTRLPDRWRAGVSICGPADLVADVRRFPPTWRRRVPGWVGDPDDPADRALLSERSPLLHAEHLRVPLLLIHGENDSRVPVTASERMYARLVELGKQVEFVRMAGEGHWNLHRENRSAEVDLILNWFSTHLARDPGR